MSNVLPPQQQKQAWRWHRTRFVLAGALFALGAAALSALALLPSYLALSVAENANAPTVRTSKPNPEDSAAILKAQTELNALAPFLATTTSPTDAAATALGVRPSAVTIDHLAYTAGSPSTLMLSGSATSRETINTYRQALQSSGRFAHVSVPVGDLVGAASGRFSITLSGTF